MSLETLLTSMGDKREIRDIREAPLPPIYKHRMMQSSPAISRLNGKVASVAYQAYPTPPLVSSDCPDSYALAERLAIQRESEQPLQADEPDVPGFEDMPDLTAAQHGAIVRQCMGITTPAASVQHKPAMARQAAPATVTCGQCAEFEQGPTHWARGVGRCSRTADGLPPVASRGYGACFPDAPRSCPDYKPLED